MSFNCETECGSRWGKIEGLERSFFIIGAEKQKE